jgi:hypothetical protein
MLLQILHSITNPKTNIPIYIYITKYSIFLPNFFFLKKIINTYTHQEHTSFGSASEWVESSLACMASEEKLPFCWISAGKNKGAEKA